MVPTDSRGFLWWWPPLIVDPILLRSVSFAPSSIIATGEVFLVLYLNFASCLSSEADRVLMAAALQESGVTVSGGEGGLVLMNTDAIRSFLASAGQDERHLSGELCELASALSSKNQVQYRILRSVWSALPASERPSLRRLVGGADFVFSSPKPRVKNEELKERLKKLAEQAERREYQELVKDIVPKKQIEEPFSSYKDQLGLEKEILRMVKKRRYPRQITYSFTGLHVALTMFTGYLVGFYAFRALFDRSVVMNAAGGILGLVCGMLLETVLFIIRYSSQDMASTSKSKKRQ